MLQSIKIYLKARKEQTWVKFLLALHQSLFMFHAKYNVSNASYNLYNKICKVAAVRRSKPQHSVLAETFNNDNVIVVKNVFDDNLLETLIKSFDSNLKQKNIITSETIVTKPNPSLLTILKDLVFRNLLMYYNCPRDYHSHCMFVKDPINNIEGLKSAIENQLLPRVNALMGCNTEIVRSWAYKTLNIEGKETFNHNSTWHRDGDVRSSIKCIVYLNQVTEENGPFRYIDMNTGNAVTVTGEAGTVIFFKSSMLRHQASNTLRGDRYCFSLLAHPSIRNELPSTDVCPDFLRKFVPFLPCSSKINLQ